MVFSILIYGYHKSEDVILKATIKKLQEIALVQYQTEIKKFDAYTEELNSNKSYSVFFDFSGNDSIIGAKYLVLNNEGANGFDGHTSFYTNNEKQELIYKKVHSKEDLLGGNLQFSILQLRNLLPQMLNDPSVLINRLSDTIINQIPYHQYDICMHEIEISSEGKLIQGHNNIYTKDNQGNFSYRLIIDKDNLPKQFIVYSYKKTVYKIISYSNYNFLPKIDGLELTYTKRDPHFVKKDFVELQAAKQKDNSIINTPAIDWILPSMNGDSVQLSKLNSKIILIEFWFPGCVGCAEAIPHLNAIQKKYSSKGLQVFGMEFTRADSTGLKAYIAKMNIEFPTLYAAGNIAKDYKVSVAPTFFLINKEGKFLYKGIGFYKDELLIEIEKNLN